MMFSLLSLLSAILILNPSCAEENTKLLLVQTLFRHGDRAPLFMYPNDPNKIDCWPEGLGMLTRLGRKQHYAVGKFLRSMYKEFVTSNPNEVSAFSSETERTINSAEALLASFYAPEGKWKFQDELNWQPIPIYTLPLKDDKYLTFNSSCPRVEGNLLRLADSKQMKQQFQKHQIMIEAVSRYSGFNISQKLNALYLHDILTVEKIHNLTIPEWAITYWNELEEITETSFWCLFDSPIYMRLRIGPFFQKIIENMREKIKGDAPDLKVHVYSTHDVNVGAALLALNFTNMPKPPYCATLLFELHEMADATVAVRLFYLNSTDPLKDMGKPHLLVLDDCSEFCPIESFTKKLQHLIPDDWEQECQLDTSDAYERDKTCDVCSDVHSAHKIHEL